jgi:CRP-like cAMP-binding protein
MEMTMYDVLLQLPLFQGLGKNELTEILTKVKFHFSKYKDGDRIITQGSPCHELVFLLSGNVKAETEFKKGVFTFGEIFTAPYLIEPFSLYGMNANYRSSYFAKGEVSIVTIDKDFVAAELNKYETFRINYINILSHATQRFYDLRGKVPVGSAERRIIEFLEITSVQPRGEKSLSIKMEDLADLLGATRLRISQALNHMKKLNMILMQRKEFNIPDLQLLSDYKSLLHDEE